MGLYYCDFQHAHTYYLFSGKPVLDNELNIKGFLTYNYKSDSDYDKPSLSNLVSNVYCICILYLNDRTEWNQHAIPPDKHSKLERTKQDRFGRAFS